MKSVSAKNVQTFKQLNMCTVLAQESIKNGIFCLTEIARQRKIYQIIKRRGLKMGRDENFSSNILFKDSESNATKKQKERKLN